MKNLTETLTSTGLSPVIVYGTLAVVAGAIILRIAK